MKVGIIGGGIAGLSAAYYIKKFSLPISQIILLESSNRFGGWINSEKLIDEKNNREIIFEYGPRTLRYMPQFKELNTIALAADLNLQDEMDLIPKSHPAAKGRYIYLNGKINLIKPNYLFSNEIFGKPLLYTLYKELKKPPRSEEILDESCYDFVSRRFNSTIADNLLDPVLKGICGGNIKELSASSILKAFYDAEKNFGSIIRGMLKGNKIIDAESQKIYSDLIPFKKKFSNLSVWRFRNGLQTLSDTLIERLKTFNDVQLNKNEKCVGIDFLKNDSNKVEIKTNKAKYDVDFVISSIYSKDLAGVLSNDHEKLKNLLNKIESVSMVVINLYFDKNILPVEGFGYLVPTKENSPILGCIFDSVFDEDHKNHSTLTLMMGGAFFDKYIDQSLVNDHEKLLNFALNALKEQIKFDYEPKYYRVSVLNNCIPQYKVGHQTLLNDIQSKLDETKLQDKLYLIGSSYNGFGINDLIFNSRNLCQTVLSKKFGH